MALYAQRGERAKPKTPTKGDVFSAIDLAGQALQHYRRTLDKYSTVPEVAATSQRDGEPILIGGMGVILLQTELSQGNGINPLELASLFANVDAATINASLTIGTLAASGLAVNDRFEAAVRLDCLRKDRRTSRGGRGLSLACRAGSVA